MYGHPPENALGGGTVVWTVYIPPFAGTRRMGHPAKPKGMVDFIGWGGKAVRAFARMPTHAVRLHEWGTQGCRLVLCAGHPPN
jgi:hypothetical protein